MISDPNYIPGPAQGETCGMCGQPAARKVGEVIFDDDPNPIRHEFTQYLCLACFDKVFMPYLNKPKVLTYEQWSQLPEIEKGDYWLNYRKRVTHEQVDKVYADRFPSVCEAIYVYAPPTTTEGEKERNRPIVLGSISLSEDGDSFNITPVETKQEAATTEGGTEQKPGDCIIITHSEHQVRALHLAYRGEFKNIAFWGLKQMEYDTEWHWLVKGDDISGTSGYHSLEHVIKRNPDLPVFAFLQWEKLNDPYNQPTTPPKQVEGETVANHIPFKNLREAATSAFCNTGYRPNDDYKAFMMGAEKVAHIAYSFYNRDILEPALTRSATEIQELRQELHELDQHATSLNYEKELLRSENEVLRKALEHMLAAFEYDGKTEGENQACSKARKALKNDQP